MTIVNNGNQATEMKVSVTGIPVKPPKASSNGFTISRTYYLPDGTAADMTNVHQNDRFVVVLSMTAKDLGSGQYVVADPLPAGFEIENPDLSASQGVADLSWLSVDTPTHVESRTDQYVAAFRYVEDTENFSTAYMVRAVSPGKFVLPGATIEDMYRPELRANTDPGTHRGADAGRRPTSRPAPGARRPQQGGAPPATRTRDCRSAASTRNVMPTPPISSGETSVAPAEPRTRTPMTTRASLDVLAAAAQAAVARHCTDPARTWRALAGS